MNPCDIKAIFTSYVSLPEGNPSKGEDSKQVIPFERSNLRIMKTAREQPRKLGFIQKGMETLRNFAIFRYISIYSDILFPTHASLDMGSGHPPHGRCQGSAAGGEGLIEPSLDGQELSQRKARDDLLLRLFMAMARKWLAILILKPTSSY